YRACSHSGDARCVISFNTPLRTVFSTLSLHDALPICLLSLLNRRRALLILNCQISLGGYDLHLSIHICDLELGPGGTCWTEFQVDRKSTRLNSSHVSISYAVFCLTKKHQG